MLFKNRVPRLVDEIEQNEKEKKPQLFPPGNGSLLAVGRIGEG